MRFLRRTFLLPLLAALCAAAPAHAAPAARHAIIVLVDGPRWTETLGDTLARWTPHLRHELAPLGAVCADFRNEGATVTMPGTSAVLTGTWEALANDGSERAHVPTIFESWRRTSGAPATDAWIVSTKQKITTLAASDLGDAAAYAASTIVASSSGATMNAGLQVLARFHPTLMEIHLGDPDVRGHANDWAGYTAAIREADSLVAVLWKALQADTALARSTAIFVTDDHGRHDDAHGGFANHGDGCEGCRHVMLVAFGAGVRANTWSDVRRRQIDIVPTIGALLGFPTPFAKGEVMTELLAPAAPASAPAADRPAKARCAQPSTARSR